MKRTSITFSSLFVAVMLAAFALGASCRQGGLNGAVGSMKLALTLPSGARVNAVSWQILSADGVVLRSGTINTSDRNATVSVDTSCPAGTGEHVVLSATTSDGVSCMGTSAPFNVVAGTAVSVNVALLCGGGVPSQPNGSVVVNGTVAEADTCPLLTSWVASPLQTSTGAAIDVAATASDADVHDVLSFAWTSTSGAFVSPSSASTQFICGFAANVILTVTVSDNHGPIPCTAAMTIPVVCIPGECGDGILQPGEQCDPPNGTTCSANCTLIPNGAGGGGGGGGAGGGTGVAPLCSPPDGCTACEMTSPDACPLFLSTVPGATHTCTFPAPPLSSAEPWGCNGFSGQALTNCQALLTCLRVSGCAQADDPTPCFCGSLDPQTCVMQGAPANAPCAAQYAAAAVGFSGTVFTQFFDPNFPVGIANNLLACDVDSGCLCGGIVSGGGGAGGTGGASGAGGMAGAGGNLGAAGSGGIGEGGKGGTPGVGGAPGTGGVGGEPQIGSCSGPTACTVCEQQGGAACPTQLVSVQGALCAFEPGTMLQPAFGCDGFVGSARDNCVALLSCIRTTHCIQGDDPTACFCGALSPADCVTQGAPANAPCVSQYTAAAIGFPGNAFTQFFDPSTPIGIANNLVACDADAPCSCP
jgi:cysteine-rich repeat protein